MAGFQVFRNGRIRVFGDSSERMLQLSEKAFAIAEGQTKHRQRLEGRVILNNIIQSYLGQAVGALIALGGIWGAYNLVQAGKDIQGAASVLGGLGTLLYANRAAVKRRERELRQKVERR